MELDEFINPIAPANFEQNTRSEPAHPLTNEDFRKLLMTPRAGPSGSGGQTVRADSKLAKAKGISKLDSENRKKKKKLYAAIKKQEDEILAELAKKYRDRARERRENANPDYQGDEDPLVSLAAYRTVAPDVKSTIDAAERRKQLIEESKYLGGDMKHTHLVKGLDYALLQKVKAELDEKEEELEDEEGLNENEELADDVAKKSDTSDSKDSKSPWTPKSIMAANIISLLSKEKVSHHHDLFVFGRMAYVVDLEDEFADEIPTTIIRSKADCPSSDTSSSLTTNDIVINKLIQIMSHLRQGGGSRKKRKEKSYVNPATVQIKKEPEERTNVEDSIYGDIGDYVPSLEKRHKDKDSGEKYRKEKSSYFDDHLSSKEKDDHLKTSSIMDSIPELNIRTNLSRLGHEAPESYAECYPGAPENDDAIVDSDDDIDFSKMDVGNKKSTVGRWDFDTQEEYGEYMSKKEALPKAAFQYGVKMADGRKTRRIPSKKDDKAKLDRDFQKITALISKRTDTGESKKASGPSANPYSEREHRKVRKLG